MNRKRANGRARMGTDGKGIELIGSGNRMNLKRRDMTGREGTRTEGKGTQGNGLDLKRTEGKWRELNSIEGNGREWKGSERKWREGNGRERNWRVRKGTEGKWMGRERRKMKEREGNGREGKRHSGSNFKGNWIEWKWSEGYVKPFLHKEVVQIWSIPKRYPLQIRTSPIKEISDSEESWKGNPWFGICFALRGRSFTWSGKSSSRYIVRCRPVLHYFYGTKKRKNGNSDNTSKLIFKKGINLEGHSWKLRKIVRCKKWKHDLHKRVN